MGDETVRHLASFVPKIAGRRCKFQRHDVPIRSRLFPFFFCSFFPLLAPAKFQPQSHAKRQLRRNGRRARGVRLQLERWGRFAFRAQPVGTRRRPLGGARLSRSLYRLLRFAVEKDTRRTRRKKRNFQKTTCPQSVTGSRCTHFLRGDEKNVYKMTFGIDASVRERRSELVVAVGVWRLESSALCLSVILFKEPSSHGAMHRLKGGNFGPYPHSATCEAQFQTLSLLFKDNSNTI